MDLTDAPPGMPLTCFQCNGPTERYTIWAPMSLNEGKPYYRCEPCSLYFCFTDCYKGSRSNRRCYCNQPCTLRLAGRRHAPSSLHLVCSLGQCGYFYQPSNQPGYAMQRPATVDDGLADIVAKLDIA